MNYLNKYILYSPDPYIESGGGEESGGDKGETGGGRGEGGGGGIAENSASLEEGKKNPKEIIGPYEFIITDITISNPKKSINPKGDKRKIRITGSAGSIFSLTIKNSSGDSILKEEIENQPIPNNGFYEFSQEFKSIFTDEGFSKSKETYDITIVPGANVKLQGVNPETPTMQVCQYADPAITVTHSLTAATIGGNITVAGSDVVLSGPANTYSKNINGYSKPTYTLTITESSGTNGKFYVKSKAFEKNTTTNTIIKKVVDRGGKTGLDRELILKPLTKRTDTTIEGNDEKTGDITKEMHLYARLEKTKTVVASLDKNNKALDYSRCSTLSNKIELSDTNDLIKGMVISGGGVAGATILSIDCNKKITISKKYCLKKLTELTFKKEWIGSIDEIASQVDEKGRACLKLSVPLDIPNKTIVEFDDNTNVVQGNFQCIGSGSDTVTLKMLLNVVKFGDKNVTYTLDLDNIITRKPNAHNKEVSIKKNSSGYYIKMVNNDTDANASSKTGAVVKKATHGTVGSYSTGGDFPDTFKYTPNANFTGEDSFTFTMSDDDTQVTSEEKIVRIIVK